MVYENDVILIYFEDKPLAFARVENIYPDHKAGWYHIDLLLLEYPTKLVTWILRDSYLDGGEFTMQGKKMRLEPVAHPEKTNASEIQEEKDKSPKKLGNGKVISFESRKNK